MLWQACSYFGMQLSWDTCVWCHLATAGIFKCPDEYIAPGLDCSNWTLSVLWHAQHTLMGHLTVLCIHPKKTKKPSALCQRGPEAEHECSADGALKIRKTKGQRFDGPHLIFHKASLVTVIEQDTGPSPIHLLQIMFQEIRGTSANIKKKKKKNVLTSHFSWKSELMNKERPSIFSELSGCVHSSVTLNPKLKLVKIYCTAKRLQ